MNIFTKGLNYLKDLFSVRKEQPKETEPSPVAQTTPTGFFSEQKIDPVLRFGGVTSEELAPSTEIAEREEREGLLPELTELEHQNIFRQLSAKESLGEELDPIEKQQQEESGKIAAQSYADVLTLGKGGKVGREAGELISRKIANSNAIDDVFSFARNIFKDKSDDEVVKISDNLIHIKDPKLVEDYVRNVDNIGNDILRIVDDKTGKVEFRPITKDQLPEVQKFVQPDQVIDGKNYSIVKQDVGQAFRDGSQYGGIANTKDLPLFQVEPPKRAYNINLDKMTLTPEQKIRYEARLERIKPELEAARGKKMSNKEVLEAAKESDLLSRAFTREETLEANATLTKTRERVNELDNLINATDDVNRRAELIQEQLELSKILSAEASDRGRKLQAFNIQAEGVDGVRQNVLKRILKTTDKQDDLARRAAEVDWANADEVTKFYREFVNPTFREVFDEYRYNNMLSNPRTFERNLISSLFSSSVVRPTTKFVEAGVDLFTSTMTGKQRGVFFKEVPAYYKGFFGSIPQAFQDFSDVWTGRSFHTNQDLKDVLQGGSIEAFLKNKLGLNETVSKRVSQAFNIPSKGLESVDRLLMRMVSEGELAALRMKGVPENEAVKQANSIAQYSLFRAGIDTSNKTGQGAILSGIDKSIGAMDNLRKSVPLMDWFVPFIKTPMNFAKQWIEFSPAGVFTLPGSTNKKAQIAKTLIGSTITGIGAQMAYQDRTTWGVPTDPQEKELFFASGKKPYSVKIGENWVPMMYLGPWAYALALPAAFKYHQEDSKKALTDGQVAKISKSVASMAEFLSQQTFMEGLGNFVDILKGDPQASPEKTLAFTAGQTIPWQGLVRYISTIIDPVYRKADSFMEAIQRDLPYLSQNLEGYRLPTGEESTRNISSYVAPYDVTKEREEYARLQDIRTEQLQINDLLKENDEALNDEALSIVNGINDAKTKKELRGLQERLKGNDQLKKTVTSLLRKQAIYTTATLEPMQIFRNDPKAVAEIIYGRILLAETKKELQENVIDFIEELKDNNLYDDKVKSWLTRILEKETEEETLEREIEQRKEEEDDDEISFFGGIIKGASAAEGNPLVLDKTPIREGDKSVVRALAENIGILSDPNEPFAKLPLKEKAKQFGESVVEEFFGLGEKKPFLARVAGEIAIKVPTKVGFSTVKVPETLSEGIPKDQTLTLPELLPTLSGNDVNTYFQDFQDNINQGMDSKTALALSFFEGMLDIALLGSVAQGVKKALLPKKVEAQFKLNPKVAGSVIKDARLQLEARGLDTAPLRNINTSGIKSWGDLYTKMGRAYKFDKNIMPAVKAHVKTRWKDFITEPEVFEKAFGGKEFIKK